MKTVDLAIAHRNRKCVIKLVAGFDGPSFSNNNIGIVMRKINGLFVDRKLNAIDLSKLSVKSVVLSQSQLHPSDEDGGSNMIKSVGKSPRLFPNRPNISSRSEGLKSADQIGE